MNLFAVSRSPRRCARALDDVRLQKMTIETAQMLCTEMRRRGFAVPYKSTHAGHPAVVWLRSDGALQWMVRYFEALDAEYRYRRGKQHSSFTKTYGAIKKGVQKVAPARRRRPPFANCARNSYLKIDFTHVSPAPKAYRMYLQARWPGDKDARWTRRRPPRWCTAPHRWRRRRDSEWLYVS